MTAIAENVKVYAMNIRTLPETASEVTAPAYIDRHDTHENISYNPPAFFCFEAKYALNRAKIADGPFSLAIMWATRQVISPPIIIVTKFILN